MTSVQSEKVNFRFIDGVAAFLAAEGLPVSSRQKRKISSLAQEVRDDTQELSDIRGLRHFAITANGTRKFMPGHYLQSAWSAALHDGKPWAVYVQQAPAAGLRGAHVVMSLETFAEVVARLEEAEK